MAALADLRILVVEDEVFVGIEIAHRLQSLGCQVIGPISHLAGALDAADSDGIDGALLDVNIRSNVVFPVAVKLLARHVPVVLATGYDPRTLPPPWRDLPCLGKPFTGHLLEEKAREVFGGGATTANPPSS